MLNDDLIIALIVTLQKQLVQRCDYTQENYYFADGQIKIVRYVKST